MKSLFGIILLVLNILAIINIFKTPAAVAMKILWTLLILILPVVGLIIWYLAGPKSGKLIPHEKSPI